MGIEETLRFIHATSWMGSRLGLERMRDLMHRLGNPQDELHFIHVAGTNGKGSACAMLSSILTTAGYRTGMYTSPHLVRVNERFRIDGVDISDESLISIAAQVKLAVDEMEEKPTEFEIITAIAFLYFRQQNCDIVVLEVGLGGRLDATNVITTSILSVIMNIGLEHTAVLGDTLGKIATEKAGIIKPNSIVVTYQSKSIVESVFERICAEQNAVRYKTNFDGIVVRKGELDGQLFDWNYHKGIELVLPGRHQLLNAATVLNVIDQLRVLGWTIYESAVREGMRNARWPARFEVLCRYPLFILDGAHNPQCVEMLEQSLELLFPKQKAVFIAGVMKDKDYVQMLNLISHRIKEVICLTPDSDRAMPAETLTNILKGFEIKATAFDNVESGIIAALSAAKGRPVIAFGSLYLAGSVRDSFPRAFKKWQRKESIRIRNAMSDSQRAARSQKIVQCIAESAEFKRAHIIMSYRAMRGEVDLSSLDEIATQTNKKIAYPLCVNSTEMVALQPNNQSSWKKGALGIFEPNPEDAILVQPEEIDLVLCPCTAFDEDCNRLGMGAGYYDRFLRQCKNATITAVAFALQKSPNVMMEEHDQKMDQIFSNNRIYRTNETNGTRFYTENK